MCLLSEVVYAVPLLHPLPSLRPIELLFCENGRTAKTQNTKTNKRGITLLAIDRGRIPCSVVQPRLSGVGDQLLLRQLMPLLGPGLTGLLPDSRIVQTEPGYQAELRFLQFPGTVFNTLQIM